MHPDDVAHAITGWRRAVELEAPYEGEFRLRRHDGVYRWHLARGTPVRDAGGRPIRWFGTTTDIDDLHRATEAVRQSEQRFRDIAENIREVFWLTDEADNIIYVSPAYEEIWGRSCAELYSRKAGFIDGVHPDDRPRLLEHLRTYRAGFDTEYRVLRPDGTVRWVRDRAFPVRDASGRITRVAGVAEDITAQRELGARLHYAHQLIGAVQEAIIATDPTGRILSWNEQATAQYGWSGEEALGRNVLELVGIPAHGDAYSAALARCKDGQKLVTETRARHKDGRSMWVSICAFPIRDAEGTVTHLVGTSFDVTERRQLEHRYHHAQKMEAVGRLAGGIAHDFNNLLTVIGASADFLLAAVPDDSDMRADAEEIKRAALRATGLTRQLLAFGRRQGRLDRRVLDPNGTVAHLEKMLARLIGEDIALQLDLSPGVPHVYMDEGQLEQAITNLVVNARDAMPDGGLIRVATRAVMLATTDAERHGVTAGRFASITVTDTGCGMSREVLAHVFEPFFTTKEAGRGTGLGLATAYGIVRHCGGFVKVESELGQGSTFTLCIPASEEPARQPIEGETPAEQPAGAETVLLVEDQAEVRTVVKRILIRHGYQVVEAADGLAGVLALEQHREPIDLVLSDVVMPVMGGADVLRAVRAARPAMPCILMSGYNDERAIRPEQLDEHTTLLSKPIRAEGLLAAVRSALDGARK